VLAFEFYFNHLFPSYHSRLICVITKLHCDTIFNAFFNLNWWNTVLYWLIKTFNMIRRITASTYKHLSLVFHWKTVCASNTFRTSPVTFSYSQTGLKLLM
jgi:hypothetical protein